MDLIERMNPAIDELPVDGDPMDEDPARIALPSCWTSSLAEDDRVMLSLLVNCRDETRGQALGAVAVEVAKVLPWDGLAGWFGEDMLVRRIAEMRAAVEDDGMETSEEERAALDLAAGYATGNRPQAPWERLVRRHLGAETVAPGSWRSRAGNAAGESRLGPARCPAKDVSGPLGTVSPGACQTWPLSGHDQGDSHPGYRLSRVPIGGMKRMPRVGRPRR